jgi:hypothetical protein
MFRSGRTRPADGQSNNSETLSRIQSLADYTIDTLESSFQKRQWVDFVRSLRVRAMEPIWSRQNQYQG